MHNANFKLKSSSI